MDFILAYPPPWSSPTLKNPYLPFGGLYLSEALLRRGYETAILVGTMDEVKAGLKKLVHDGVMAVGISTMSGKQLANALKLAEFIRSNWPDVPIIWGGSHVTLTPEQSICDELCDYIVWGEGEDSLPLLLDCLRTGQEPLDVKGIGYKKEGVPIVTENSGYTSLAGTFKLPYHLLDMETYARKLIIGMERCFNIFTSRGCPFRCRFCANASTVWPNTRIRYHTIDHIMNDIEVLINDYQADGLLIADENFFVVEKRIHELCTAVIKRGFNKIKYRAVARFDQLSRLSDSTYQLMKEANFIAIGGGVESGSQRILDYIGKGITVEQIIEADEKLTRHGFYKNFRFMAGVPTETMDDIKLTLSLLHRLAGTSRYCPFPFSWGNYIPFPGSELYDEAIKHGFQPPQSLREWAYGYDFDDLEGSMSVVRPWVKGAYKDLLLQANQLCAKLNSLFRGNYSDEKEIMSVIHEIEKLALN